MISKKTCIAPYSSSTHCPHKVIATISLPVPGGTIGGATCRIHVEVVQRMVHEEAEQRRAAGRLAGLTVEPLARGETVVTMARPVLRKV